MDAQAVEVGAVARLQVLDGDAAALHPEEGVIARHRRVLDHDAAAAAAPEGGLALAQRDPAALDLEVPGAALGVADRGCARSSRGPMRLTALWHGSPHRFERRRRAPRPRAGPTSSGAAARRRWGPRPGPGTARAARSRAARRRARRRPGPRSTIQSARAMRSEAVLDHHHAVAALHQPAQGAVEQVDVGEVEAGRRLVEEEEALASRAPAGRGSSPA